MCRYAVYLGMDLTEDRELLYIAEMAMAAPLPSGWTEHDDADGREFYFNTVTGVPPPRCSLLSALCSRVVKAGLEKSRRQWAVTAPALAIACMLRLALTHFGGNVGR
jgi:hypothetical protein